MDYKEEQMNEVEALEAIYCGDLETLGTDPPKFCIKIKSDCDMDKEEGLACRLKFTYTEKYPEELPVLEIIDRQNLTEENADKLMNHLLNEANENIGMVMVFTIVSAAQEWLSSRWDQIKHNKELEAERRLKESEEEDRRRFEGTKVTVESFMTWKKAFEEEINLVKKEVKDENQVRKLTGRELFLQDKTLIESDLKFLEDGDAIKVDESLFQDLDELGDNEFLDESHIQIV